MDKRYLRDNSVMIRSGSNVGLIVCDLDVELGYPLGAAA